MRRLRNQPFIVLHPFARGEGKSLSLEHVTEFCSAARPLTVIVAGVGTIKSELPYNAINLLNQTTIRQMIWLLGAAEFVVSVDSGPMHLAAAINPRTLSIHTWSDPRLVGPFSDDAWIWQGGRDSAPASGSNVITVRPIARDQRHHSDRKLRQAVRPR